MTERVRAAGLLVLLATALSVVVGAGLRAPCVLDATVPARGHAPAYGCYNDVQTIWTTRHVGAHEVAYTGPIERVRDVGGLSNVRLGAGQVEYPLLTGVFIWLTGLLVSGRGTFLLVTMIALTPFAFLTSFALWKVAGRRALLFAATPPLALYAFYNWDLLPVTATAFALWAWRRDRPVVASVLLALGAAAKLWPGFVLIPLVLGLLLERRWRAAGLSVVASVATFVGLHLPWLLTDWRGLLGPYLMQSVRANDRTTNAPWYFLLPDASLSTVNLVSAVSVLTVWLVVLVVAVRRRHGPDGFPGVAAAGAMICAYVLLGRVDSPQYALWLLPFLVLLEVRWPWLVAFFMADVWLYLQWTWLYVGHGTAASTSAVWLRIAVLLALTVVLAGRRTARQVPEGHARTFGHGWGGAGRSGVEA